MTLQTPPPLRFGRGCGWTWDVFPSLDKIQDGLSVGLYALRCSNARVRRATCNLTTLDAPKRPTRRLVCVFFISLLTTLVVVARAVMYVWTQCGLLHLALLLSRFVSSPHLQQGLYGSVSVAISDVRI